VLADVPCSGTGTLARHPEIKWRLRVEDLTDMQSRQIQILGAAASQLAPGGKIVYSTCSLEKEENSDVAERTLASDKSLGLLDCRAELEILRAEGEMVLRDLESLVSGRFLQILPGRNGTDGFFAAIIQKLR
jgi:16S rRNA (cytosine967-C5)-methyltransferase